MKYKALFSVTLLSLLLSACGGVNNTEESSEESKDSSEESSSVVESESSEESIDDSTPKLPLNPLTALYSYSFPQLGKEVMPVSAWVSPWHVGNQDFINIEQYEYIKEAGLNSIYGLYERIGVTDPDVEKALECADKVGLAYLVRDDSLMIHSESDEDFKAHVDPFLEHESFAGFLVRDEPGKATFSSYVSARKLFRKYYTKYAYYINLFPNYARGVQLSGSNEEEIDYDEYLSSFLSTVQPQMLSYDFYGMDKNFPDVSDGYFEQIYTAKQYADANKIPFWPFVQANKFANSKRVPHESDIYWQIGSNLVFGAKAIQYFCYMCPNEEPSWEGNFVDVNGNKTELYPYFKKGNNFITSVDHILMKSTLVDLMQYGDSPAPFPEALEFVVSSREIKEVKTQSNIIVGVFNHDGKTAAYVFNNDLVNAGSLKIQFTTTVDADIYNFESQDSIKGVEEISLSLAPGASALVDLTNY